MHPQGICSRIKIDCIWKKLFLFPEGRTLELHSPDAVHSCVLRASDASEAAAWFNTLHSALAVLTTAALHEASRAIPDLRHIGWLLRRPRCEVIYLDPS